MTDSPPRASFGYRMTRTVAMLLLRMEYRRVEATGAERCPSSGPCLLVANHHNSLIDSMAILATSTRPAGPMAKAPLWKSRVIRPFLDAVEAVPVFRPEDAAENEGRGARANLETFAVCIERLRKGRVIVLFPEGMSRPSPKLLPLRTGAARIAIDAEVPVTVVPIGLVHEPPTKRRGSLLVRYGEPFVIDGRAPRASRRGQVVDATRRMETSIRALLAEAESIEDVELLRMAASVLAHAQGDDDSGLDERQRRVRQLAVGFEALRAVDPVERLAIRADAARFARHLALLDLSPDRLDTRYGVGIVARFVVKTLVRVAIGAPLAALASIATAPARLVGDVVALRGGEVTEDVLPFARILSRTFFLAIETLVVALLLGVVVSPIAGVLTLLALPSLYAVHVVWRDGWIDVVQSVRAFVLLAGGKLRTELLAERQALVDRIERAGRAIAPPATPPSA